MKPTTKTSPVRSAHKASAKTSHKPRMGSLHRAETTNLVMTAQEAFHYQQALKNVEPGTSFDDWRRDQVMDAVGLAGISKIGRGHFRTVKAHFLTLAGRDDEAFALQLQTGQKRDHGDPTDTRESTEQIVFLLRQSLAEHYRIATVPIVTMIAESADEWARAFPGQPCPAPNENWLADIASRKAAIEQSGKGPILTGWLLSAARQRCGKASLTMDTLAERIDRETLFGLLSHLRNHISRREGREDKARRGPRRYPKKSDPGMMLEDSPF